MLSDPNPEFLHPVQGDEFLPPISLWTTLGGFFMVGTFGVAVTLASLIQYNVTVKTPGTVRPAGELRIVQAATEGTVQSIEVKENQHVKQGQAIARVDDSRLQIQKSQLQGNIRQDRALLAQIEDQISTLDRQTLAESSLVNRTIASAQAGLSLNQRDYSDRRITTQTEVQEAEAVLELAREERKRYQQLANTGAIALLQVKEKEQAFKAAQARLERAKATRNPSAAPVTIATEQIAQEKAKGQVTLAALSKELQELVQRRVAAENQFSQDQKELQQLETELKKSVIRASTDGTVLKLDLRNPGQTVRPGELIAQIAPSGAPLVVRARVAAQDISKVKVCKADRVENCEEGKVQLRFSAYPYPDYGSLKGAVRTIAADATLSQGSVTGISSYEVMIQPERLYLLKSDRPYLIQSGMEVTADIISREETVLKFILRKARLLTDL